MDRAVSDRLSFAKSTALAAGKLALDYFAKISQLEIKQKGAQDHVSNADTDVETFIREKIAASFASDGVVGEEFDPVASQSGYVWVIDPIDGTANFIRGIPAWCVVIACVKDEQTVVGVIYDPCNDELYSASGGGGAHLNGDPIRVAATQGLHDGNTGVGMNGRTEPQGTVRVIEMLVERGGIFYRNASGALMLAYVASGRLIGYVESHMNAWDCLAGQLLIAEAGGKIETQNAQQMLRDGGRVIASAPDIFEELVEIGDHGFA